MKVLLYSGAQKMIEKSGVGRAIYHQMEALDANHVEYTTNVKDDWDGFSSTEQWLCLCQP